MPGWQMVHVCGCLCAFVRVCVCVIAIGIKNAKVPRSITSLGCHLSNPVLCRCTPAAGFKSLISTEWRHGAAAGRQLTERGRWIVIAELNYNREDHSYSGCIRRIVWITEGYASLQMAFVGYAHISKLTSCSSHNLHGNPFESLRPKLTANECCDATGMCYLIKIIL